MAESLSVIASHLCNMAFQIPFFTLNKLSSKKAAFELVSIEKHHKRASLVFLYVLFKKLCKKHKIEHLVQKATVFPVNPKGKFIYSLDGEIFYAHSGQVSFSSGPNIEFLKL